MNIDIYIVIIFTKSILILTFYISIQETHFQNFVLEFTACYIRTFMYLGTFYKYIYKNLTVLIFHYIAIYFKYFSFYILSKIFRAVPHILAVPQYVPYPSSDPSA